MICQMCKDKVATIHLKEIVDAVVTEIHLCKECFETREREGGQASAPSTNTSELFDHKTKKRAKTQAKTITCRTCGTTDEEFSANGRLGCEDCYRTFAESLEPILNRVHGSTEHRGKVPSQMTRNLDLKTELRRLQEDLQSAILAENYERAAKLRDKIKQYENIGAHTGTAKEPLENV